MRRLYAIALIALLAALYVVLLIASLGHSLGLVLFAGVALYAVDELLRHTEDGRLLRRLQQVGADPMWRVFYREVLIAVFLLRWGQLSQAQIIIVVVAVIAHHLIVGLGSGLAMIIQWRRMRRVETRNLPVPGADLPPAPPPWMVGSRGSRLQMRTEVFFLAGLAWAFFADSATPVAAGAAAMVVGALLVPVALVPQLIALGRLPDAETRLKAVQAAFLELKPTVILYFSGGLGAVYQVNMWFETLERLDRPALVVLRERRYLSRLAESSVPVMCLPYTADVMNFDFTGARVALYVANVGRNVHLLRVPTLKSAFIGHGDSDKVASFNPFAKVYDEVWVAGEAGRERYVRAQVGVRAEDIVVVGRPQLDEIQQSVPRPEGAPFTVLYAPTWEGWIEDPFASSLLAMGREIVRTLLAQEGVRVVFKPHPLSGTVAPDAGRARDEISAMLAAAGPQHVSVLDNETTLYDCFDDSDALISDISSVVSDYLRSEKPYFVTNGAEVSGEEFRDQNPSAGAAYLVGPRAAGLREGLSHARGADPLRMLRHEVRTYLLGDPDVASIALFRRAVDELAGKAADQSSVMAVDDGDLRLEQLDESALSPADGVDESTRVER